MGDVGFLLLMIRFGLHFDPSFRQAPAFIAESSFGIIMRIGKLSAINPQPTAAFVNIVSGILHMQGTLFPHSQIAGHFMKIRQFEPPVSWLLFVV
jgi:hypothetical protein